MAEKNFVVDRSYRCYLPSLIPFRDKNYLNMKLFQKRTEDFTCENCGFFVKGTGYTNHCSKCLYSKHVDITPGDRQAMCGGLMKPISLEQKHGEVFIVHKCAKSKF